MPTDPFSRLASDAEHGRREPSFAMSTAQLGMILLLVALGVLFAASLVAYVITRTQVDVWRATGARELPAGLVASTALLIGASVAIQAAYESIRRNRHSELVRRLVLTLALAGAFLVGQAFNWVRIAREELGAGPPTLFAFTFFMLTGLHAVHVLGGFVPLGVVLARARQREYSSSRREGIKLCVQYWHFLLVVWFILVTTMYLAV
jgi:cytochrome c oxidase subunit III